MGEAWWEWVPRFDAWAATYDADTADPWLAYEAAWAFVAERLVKGLGSGAAADLPAADGSDRAPAVPVAHAPLRGAHVVDVGCGTGAFLRRLADLGARVTGVEPSAGMREVAAARVPEAELLDGHLASIPLRDGAATTLISTYTVSHLAPVEQLAALAEMLRVVAGRGPIVVVDVPVVPPDDLPRVRDLLTGAGRADQVDWYARGMGLDVPAWRQGLEATGRRVIVERLGPLVSGLAAVDPAA
jgi:SAM-dependent methyltransferase